MNSKFHIFVVFWSLLCVGCSDYYELPSSSTATNVVEWMDENLSTYYLYNDEYNTLDRDLTLSYNNFLDVTLKSMTTNVLDYKDGSVYSYITRTASTKSAQTRISSSKYMEASLGLAMIGGVYVDRSTRIELCICAVYADSPLHDKGVRRGDHITKVNGTYLTISNYTTYGNALCSPTAGTSYTLTINDADDVEVSAEYIYCSPILVSDVWEAGDKKVGYLSYLSFDAAYNSELVDVLEDFKREGVNEMILDMRLNGGGYVSTSNILSAAIAGSASSNRVFTYYTYNPTRGKSLLYFDSSHSDCRLNLERLYCLVSGSTASASELVINSLRGIDVEVILIGSTTEGKNAAMEVMEATYGDYDYSFAPITIALSNAKGFGDYAEGFDPDYECDDWGDNGSNVSDFTQEEIMISTALGLIADDATAVLSTTRSSVASSMRGEIFSAGNIKRGNLVIND